MQGITRPEGTPIEHTSIPFLLSMQNAGQLQNMEFQKNRMNDMLKQADEMAKMIDRNAAQYGLMQQLTDTTHHMIARNEVTWRRSPKSCGITSRISRISAGRSAATSTGKSTATTFPSAGR